MKKLPNRNPSRGFTLIELLVVIGILAILLAIVLIAINPARQFGQANDTKRRSDTTAILNAVGAYAADNKGNLPANLTAQPALTPAPISDAGVDICDDLVTDYIPALPTDPELNTADIEEADCANTYDTGYTISHDSNGRVTVYAPNADVTTPIQITR